MDEKNFLPRDFIKKSTLDEVHPLGLHVAILMDGNGRWAATRGLARSAGHRAGAETARRIVEAAPGLGIGTLTLFTFSSDNWERPRGEVAALLRVVEEFLDQEAARCEAQGVRIRAIGRRDRIGRPLADAINAAEKRTAAGRKLDLRLAVDYSSRDSILRAACWMLSSREVTQAEFSRRLGQVMQAGGVSLDVDLLIRTGGEQRLSDFMLWECAYAELIFTPRMWPEFSAVDLAAAVGEFHSRERRFGRVPEAAAV
jgi:undecaprenyl diphosphate synthase